MRCLLTSLLCVLTISLTAQVDCVEPNVVDECGVCNGPGFSFTCWDGSAVCDESDCSLAPEFSPIVNFVLGNLMGGETSSLTYSMSQDDGESEIFASSVVSDSGSCNLSGLGINDVIGFGSLYLELYSGNFDIASELVVSNINGGNYTVFNYVTSSTSPVYPVGSISGGFVISNAGSGVSIYTELPLDGDFIAEAYDMSVTFSNLLVNPEEGPLTFTSVLTAELGSEDVQEFVFGIISGVCTDPAACNYDVDATNDDSCVYANPNYACNGVCINDADGDLVCDEFEIAGCTDSSASNFSSNATNDDGSCLFGGCMDEAACDFDPYALSDDGSCDYTCCPGPGCCDEGTYWNVNTQTCVFIDANCSWQPDSNADGVIGITDLLNLLSVFGLGVTDID